MKVQRPQALEMNEYVKQEMYTAEMPLHEAQITYYTDLL